MAECSAEMISEESLKEEIFVLKYVVYDDLSPDFNIIYLFPFSLSPGTDQAIRRMLPLMKS
jgi:hypothetical protein